MRNLPQNVWILAISFSFAMSGVALLVFVSGLIGSKLAPYAHLATLPTAMFIVGNALATIPAALLSKRIGRKNGGYSGFMASLIGTAVCAQAIQLQSFYVFVFGVFLMGCGTAFYHQFRFAAIESLEDKNDAGPALSLIMLFSIVGSILGPELGTFGKSLVPTSADYVGSFLLFGVMIIFAMLVFTQFHNPEIPVDTHSNTPRPLNKIVFQTGFLIALASAAIGYSLMSFLMTSTPISMHVVQGHALTDAKWVIQSHLAAMFLPSLFSGFLIKRFGAEAIMLLGGLLYLTVIIVALAGQHVIHYWWALVLLGVGWNFLFLSGTTLLTQYYLPAERFKAQAVNDFSVFTLQACASLSAAWVLFTFGWHVQVWLCLPLTLVIIIASIKLISKKVSTSQEP